MIDPALLYYSSGDPTPKNVAYSATPPVDGADAIVIYNVPAEVNYSHIEGFYGVPVVGMASVIITLSKQALFVQETISVDTTDSATFWADIQNWLFAENSFDIVINGISYEIEDPSNKTYVILS